ncbi:MAG: sigma-70 family RNA polymerase sigma factor [Planctomycetota bacterium]|nr:MAG: sigma-70 family RNA polymerase sigma factor [Planctomycetota bacterium]
MASPQQLDSSESSGDKLPTSASLLDRARHRDDLAWNELVELYAPLVYFWCRKTNIVEHDIPDVVQEVFRAVVTGIDGFRKDRTGDTFRGWLRTVTRSKLADHFRRLNRNPAWQAFWRVTVDGLSATEVANELGMKSGTVRVAKSRVLQRLRKQLGDVE